MVDWTGTMVEQGSSTALAGQVARVARNDDTVCLRSGKKLLLELLLEIEQVPGGPSLPRVFLSKKPGEVQLLLVRKQEIIHFL